MKKILLSVAAFLVVMQLSAQTPQGINYQAVVRNTAGAVLPNTNVGMKVSIRQNSPTGTIVYSESFTPTTSAIGLVNFVIGQGNVLSGTFSGINWGTGTYFCEIAVDVAGGTNYTVLGAQQFMSVPYALYAATSGNTAPTPTLDGAYDGSGAGQGRTITADSGPVQINGSGANTAALGVGFSGTGNAINAANTNAGNTFSTIQATTNSSTMNNSAIYGQSSGAARAITGEVTATSTADAAVRGNNLRTTGGIGVEGVGYNGVSGQTNYRDGFGVYGQNFDLVGPLTANSVGVGGVGYVGVIGQSTDPANGGGVASLDNIIALGNLTVSGTKNFRIDHPLDPSNKYLNHFSIESNEVLNIYRGTAAFDANGEAVVQLPEWFDAVNRNPSYQLTPIGAYAPLYIKEKLNDGRFVIAGGSSNMEVSWSVYAERNDPYLLQYPDARQVEQLKNEREKGKYLRPDLYEQAPEKGILQPINR